MLNIEPHQHLRDLGAILHHDSITEDVDLLASWQQKGFFLQGEGARDLVELEALA